MTAAVRSRIALPERGVELSLLDFGGEGPLALLSHANGFCAAPYEPFARRLSERFHVLAYDSRGHGASSKPAPPEAYDWESFVDDLLALARQLCAAHDTARVALAIGHSFGGTATLTAATRHPERFARIALLDPVVMPPAEERARLFPERVTGGNPMAEIARKRRAVFDSREAAGDAWAGREAFADWDPRAFALYLQHGLVDRADGGVELACPREVEAAVFDAGGTFDVFGEVEKLRTPGLLLRAAQGNFPAELYARLVALAPSLHLETLPTGHLMPLIAPEAVAERVLAFATD